MESIEVPSYSPTELKEIKDAFADELEAAARGTKNSLAFLRNNLPPHEMVADGEKYQAISIGGTVCKNAICQRSGDTAEIIELRQTNLPLFQDKDVFLSFMDQQIDPTVQVLGLSFAFPLEPFLRVDRIDGILLRPTKGHACTGLIGEAIGEELENHIAAVRGQHVRIAVANDTIGLVLSGLVKEQPEAIVGCIVGTGTNSGLFLDPKTVINIESGNFSRFKQTETGILVDQTSNNKGTYLFEKEISGAYLYRHYNELVKQHPTDIPSVSSTQELNDIAHAGPASAATLARSLFSRSASLVAAKVAALYSFKRIDYVLFVMEGSLFWDGYGYREAVELHLRSLGIGPEQVHFTKIANSDIVGASQLPLI